MRRIKIWEAAVCLMLLLTAVGCASSYQAPSVVEIQSMTGLDGKPEGLDSPLSPVLEDVYDRSISTEVYSVE